MNILRKHIQAYIPFLLPSPNLLLLVCMFRVKQKKCWFYMEYRTSFSDWLKSKYEYLTDGKYIQIWCRHPLTMLLTDAFESIYVSICQTTAPICNTQHENLHVWLSVCDNICVWQSVCGSISVWLYLCVGLFLCVTNFRVWLYLCVWLTLPVCDNVCVTNCVWLVFVRLIWVFACLCVTQSMCDCTFVWDFICMWQGLCATICMCEIVCMRNYISVWQYVCDCTSLCMWQSVYDKWLWQDCLMSHIYTYGSLDDALPVTSHVCGSLQIQHLSSLSLMYWSIAIFNLTHLHLQDFCTLQCTAL